MDYQCAGCGNTYSHKTGLCNHRRFCKKYKNYDGLARYKRRRLERQAHPEMPALARLNDDHGPSRDDNAESGSIMSALSQSNDDHGPSWDTIAGSAPPIPEADPPQTSTRSGRTVRFPQRFDDYLPVMRTALAHIPSKENRYPSQAQAGPDSESLGIVNPDIGIENSQAGSLATQARAGNEFDSLTTNADRFGIYRVYARKPLHNSEPLQSNSDHRPETAADLGFPYYHPFSNPAAAAMMVAYYSGAPVQSVNKTDQTALLLGSLWPDINPSDLCNFSAAVEKKRLNDYLTSASESSFQHEDGWLESSVRIRLPLDKKKIPESDAAEFEIGGVFHRDIIDVISSVYQSDVVKSFNHIPFKEFWRPSDDAPPERLYGEIFSSQAMLDADDEICRSCMGNDSGSLDVEAISVPLLLYSDSTHLASFGTASCWPVYLFFGSQSKYIRAMPSSSACHHIAYMPKVRHVY